MRGSSFAQGRSCIYSREQHAGRAAAGWGVEWGGRRDGGDLPESMCGSLSYAPTLTRATLVVVDDRADRLAVADLRLGRAVQGDNERFVSFDQIIVDERHRNGL